MDVIERFSYIFKFLIIGNSGSGKTCILKRYIEQKFVHDTPHTIGAEFGSKILHIDRTPVKIQIWDTAGQERFKSMSRSYYHDAVGALLVYDITSRDSYNALSHWLSDVRQLAGPGIVVILVGNKRDLQETNGQVTHWEAKQFAQENDLQFVETSALTGENVDDTFTQCTRNILAKLKTGELDPDRLSPVRPCVDLSLAGSDHSRRVAADSAAQQPGRSMAASLATGIRSASNDCGC